MDRVLVLASGGGSNFQSLIDYLAGLKAPNWNIIGLVTSSSSAGALDRAANAGIPSVVVETDNAEERDLKLLEAMEFFEPGLVVLAGWLKKIGPEVLGRYRDSMINIHPGPLPETAGLYGPGVHSRVLELGLTKTAVNIHYVDENYDTGRKIVTYPITVPNTVRQMDGGKEATEALQKHVLSIEHRLLPLLVNSLINTASETVIQGSTTLVLHNGQKIIDKGRLTVDLG